MRNIRLHFETEEVDDPDMDPSDHFFHFSVLERCSVLSIQYEVKELRINVCDTCAEAFVGGGLKSLSVTDKFCGSSAVHCITAYRHRRRFSLL